MISSNIENELDIFMELRASDSDEKFFDGSEKSKNKGVLSKEKRLSYRKLPIKHIAVCATMSAGKSTFVNALLGNDILPARNEATTARITSIYDLDGSKNMVGYILKNGQIAESACDVKQDELDKWNSDDEVGRIFLQADLDGIPNKGMIVAVHDTPGINNSRDASHYSTTFDFLKSHPLDALIFVANAEQLCTEDEYSMLKTLMNEVVKPKKLSIIFVLNKMDSIDPEKENIAEVIINYKEYLKELGFHEPAVFPVSAHAARLLKMALNNKSAQFTRHEKREFDSVLFDFMTFYNFSSIRKNSKYKTALHQETKENSQKNSERIVKALENTGILAVEKKISVLFGKAKNGVNHCRKRRVRPAIIFSRRKRK
jgi:GTPase